MVNFDKLKGYAEAFISDLIHFLPHLIAAILIFIVGWWLIKVVIKYIEKLLIKQEVDLALQKFALTLLKWALKILLFLIVISQLGIATASLLTVLGAASLAIGLALQGSLSNFAGGVIIILLKPFKLGDWIEVNGISGSVKDISLFYTKLNTFGNQLAIIPNGELSNENIVNYSGESTRREALTFRISYDSDIQKAREILLNLVQEQEGILEDPAPQILVSELAENSVNFSVRYFAPNAVFWDCHWYTIEQAKIRLEAAGITIPVPQRNVYLHKTDSEKKDEDSEIIDPKNVE